MADGTHRQSMTTPLAPNKREHGLESLAPPSDEMPNCAPVAHGFPDVRARRSASGAAGAAVAGVANYGVVELHPWTSTVRPARTTTSSNKLDVPR